jgi:hypothetical protein
MPYKALETAASDLAAFSAAVLRRPLRHYQLRAARAIWRSIALRQGRTFTVMMARQMGKNELSAHVEAYLLYLHAASGGTLVKAAPTFRPQLINSKARLEALLARLPAVGPFRGRYGYILELGAASIHFLSADEESNVMGATASLLLEIDEAQDVSEDKYLRDFRPMGATANVTTVLYGTAWSNDTLLAHQCALNLRDDPDAHIEFPWTVLADLNPSYREFVQSEIRRLGVDHPIIKTQYLLESLESAGHLFTEHQLALLQGTHPPLCCHSEESVPAYVAGIDIAGEAETGADESIRRRHPRKDSTVVTIARVTHPPELLGEPLIEVVHHDWWTGRDHSTQYTALLELLKDRWRCQAVCVDATGVGAGVASWLAKFLPGRVEQIQFTRPLKSDLGYELLSAVNASRLKLYAPDGSKESQEFWNQARHCRYAVSPTAALNFFAGSASAHDDFITSLALCVRAAGHLLPEPAGAIVYAPPIYSDGRY